MRPQGLAMEGFSAFRDHVEVDFTDADLFAFVGPTGAGKSSVIDAMVFALYGSVPRYDSENLVHPVITQGALEAKVSLSFTSGGQEYRATRVVRRTKSGASTKEARLERGDEVLADDARGMTNAVVEVLGLDLEQFTKCVVLPQGAFATLLHDTKAKRQDLLVKLLDLGVYERVASAARLDARAAAARAEALDDQIRRIGDVSDAAVDTAAQRVVVVEAVIARLDEVTVSLHDVDEELRRATDQIASLQASAEALALVVAPAGIDALAGARHDAESQIRQAQSQEQAMADEVAAAETARAGLPAEVDLRRWAAAHAARADLDEKVARGSGLVSDLERKTAEVESDHTAAAEMLMAAKVTLEAARVDHAAAAVVRHLHVGDDCPVCGSAIESLVEIDGHALRRAELAEVDAAKAERVANDARTAHHATLDQYRTRLAERIEERDAAVAAVADAPDPGAVAVDLDRVSALDQRLDRARRGERDARRVTDEARAAAAKADADLAAARAAFDRIRDQVASQQPPPPTGDPVADWESLTAWADARRTTIDGELDVQRQDRADTQDRRRSLLDGVVAEARSVGIDVQDPGAARDACVSAVADGRIRHQQLLAAQAEAAALIDRRDGEVERRAVHELLAEQLGARGFEAWLLDEALDVLLASASEWLEQLSSQRYAMAVDDKHQFVVVDHANADERRLARTLSGGETFLASLALALALAEHVSELSASGGRSLDAIFLDEGFGTLDPETLEVVATAIEELGATGRMVGVISHVRELAERVPVRFEITKAPGSSAIRRVDT